MIIYMKNECIIRVRHCPISSLINLLLSCSIHQHPRISTVFFTFSNFEQEIMAAIQTLNPKAEFARAAAALQVNTSAAIGLQNVLKTNLGPKGTMKM